ncbi:MAG: hypothetical protein ABIY55_08030 [Kofleriaceae bacterium]
MRSTIALPTIAAAVKRRLPAAHRAHDLPISLDQAHSQDGPRFQLGAAATGDLAVDGKAGRITGHVSWKLEQLLGASDWTALVPTELVFDVAGAGGMQLGKLTPPGEPLGGRFALSAATLRQALLHEPTGDEVWAGVHRAGDVIAVSITKTADSDEGAMAQIHLSFLLRQLERLGGLGRKLLEKLADVALPSWKAGGATDVLAKLDAIAQTVGQKLLKLSHGVLQIALSDGHFLRWNLKLQLPHLGPDFDLSSLVPEFDLALPGLPGLSAALRATAEFGKATASFALGKGGKLLDELKAGIPQLHLPDVPSIHVAWLEHAIQLSLDLGDLFGDGPRSFGLQLSLDAIGKVIHKAAELGGKFLGGIAGKTNLAALRAYFHLGADGILRIFDDKQPDAGLIAFDLKALFDGITPEALAPVELRSPKGAGVEVAIGKLNPPGPLIGERFAVPAATLRHVVLHEPAGEDVWVGVHHAEDLIAVSITKDAASDTGALAQVRLSYLLAKLERLGGLGRKLLEKLADAVWPSWKVGGKSDVLAMIGDIARKVTDKMVQVASGALELVLPDGHFLRWNLKLQLPHLGADLDLSSLFPEFDLALPGTTGLSIALRATEELAGTLLGKFHLPRLPSGEWLQHLPSLHLPAMPEVQLAWIDQLLGVSIDLGNLFGDGARSFEFKISAKTITDKLQRLGAKISDKLEAAGQLSRYLHLGTDGVLRVFDPARPTRNRIGFDLKQLFDGVSFSDLIPVELHLEGGGPAGQAAVELSYGEDKAVAAPSATPAPGKTGATAKGANDAEDAGDPGKVLVHRPAGEAITSAVVEAPDWLRAQLAAPAHAKIHASLHVVGTDAVAFAHVDGTDRGLALTVHTALLASGLHSLGTFKADPASIRVALAASKKRGMLIVSLGSTDHVHGHVGWHLSRLLSNPSIESLVPDEVELSRKEGSLTVSRELNLVGLASRGTLDLAGWTWAKTAMGLDPEAGAGVEVFTNDLHGDARIALAKLDAQPHAKREGVELDLRKDFLGALDQKLHQLATRTSQTIGNALRRAQGAGAMGKLGFSMHASNKGVRVERGANGEPGHIYATFGWRHLVDLISGGVPDLEALVPDEFRVATTAMALEVQELDPPAGGVLPATAHQIGKLHPLLKDSLTTFGLLPAQFIELDVDTSKLADPVNEQLRAVGTIYDVTADQHHTTGSKRVTLELSLQAVLAQVLPHQRAWADKSAKQPKAGGTTVSAKLRATNDVNHDGTTGDAGVEMDASLHHQTKSGHRRDVELQVGWSLKQILDLLLHLETGAEGSMSAAAGYLAPTRLSGSFSTDTFRITLGNDGRRSAYHCSADDMPGLGSLLGTVLDAATVTASTLHLNLPSGKEVAASLKEAITAGGFITLAGCTLEVPTADPKAPRLYGLSLALAPAAFKRVLFVIPGAGEILKLADSVMSVLKDPVGTVQSLAYTPEALLQVVECAPEVFGKLREKGWKGIAMMLVMSSDVTTKQAVLAGRIRKAMEKAGWKRPGDAKPPEFSDVPDAYLEWVSRQDPQSLVDLYDLGEVLKKSGIEVEKTYAIPAQGLVSAEIKSKIDQIEKGFTAFATAERDAAAAKDPAAHDAATKALAGQAEALRQEMKQILGSGVKGSASAPPREGAGTDKPAEADGGKIASIAEQAKPTDEQTQDARDLFKADGTDGKVMSEPKSEYLVQKYAALSQDQLGELLSTGTTAVVAAGGKLPLLLEDWERPFVRALFVKRMSASGQHVKTGAAQSDDDAHLVAGYHAATAHAERDAVAHASQDKAAGGVGEGHGSAKGGHDDDGLGSLDEDFGGELAAGTDGAGKASGHGKSGDKHADGSGPSTDKTAGKDPHGKAGKDGKAVNTANDAQDSKDGKAGKPEPETHELPRLSELTHVSPSDARSLVHFEQGKVTLNDAFVAKLIGFVFKGTTPPATLTAIKLEGQQHSGTGADEFYEFTLGFDVKYQGFTTPTQHKYVFMPATQTTKDGTLEDPAGFLRKLEKAVVIDGKNGEPGKSPTFTHGPYTVTVTYVSAVVDYDDSVHFEGQNRRGPTGLFALATVTLQFVHIATSDKNVVVLNARNQRVVVHEGHSVDVQAPVLRKP